MKYFFVALVSLFLLLCSTSADMQETDWDYSSFKQWPEQCRKGKRQSPISFANVDPKTTVTGNLSRLVFSPQCIFLKDRTTMRIQNNGKVINVTLDRDTTVPGDPSECTVRDPLDYEVVYHFRDLHFHAMSEHKFKTLKPDVEMHIKFFSVPHNAKPAKALYIAILLQASSTINSTSVRALRHMLLDGRLPPPHAQTTCTLTENLSIDSFLPSNENYLSYYGSQTMPPCAENVHWVVFTTPVLISEQGLGKLREAMNEGMPNDFHRYGNSRPPQPIGNRTIYRFIDNVTSETTAPEEGGLPDAWEKDRKKLAAQKRKEKKRAKLEKKNSKEKNATHTTESSAGKVTLGDEEKAAVQRIIGAGATNHTMNATRALSTQEQHNRSRVDYEDNEETNNNEHEEVESKDDEEEDTNEEEDESEDNENDDGEDENDNEEDEGNNDSEHHSEEEDDEKKKDSHEQEDSSRHVDNTTNEESNSYNHTSERTNNDEGSEAEIVSNHSNTSSEETHAEENSVHPQNEEETQKPPTEDEEGKSDKKNKGQKNAKKPNKSSDKNKTGFFHKSQKRKDGITEKTGTTFHKLQTGAKDYVKEHPYRTAAIIGGIILIIWTAVKLFRSFRKPAFVVGVNPEELEPLNASDRVRQPQQYGTPV